MTVYRCATCGGKYRRTYEEHTGSMAHRAALEARSEARRKARAVRFVEPPTITEEEAAAIFDRELRPRP